MTSPNEKPLSPLAVSPFSPLGLLPKGKATSPVVPYDPPTSVISQMRHGNSVITSKESCFKSF